MLCPHLINWATRNKAVVLSSDLASSLLSFVVGRLRGGKSLACGGDIIPQLGWAFSCPTPRSNLFSRWRQSWITVKEAAPPLTTVCNRSRYTIDCIVLCNLICFMYLLSLTNCPYLSRHNFSRTQTLWMTFSQAGGLDLWDVCS